MNLLARRFRAALRRAAVLGLAMPLVGCGTSDPPRFRPNLMELVRSDIPLSQQAQIGTVLEDLFGTPDDPVVPAQSGLDLERLQRGAGSVRGKRGLYRAHCARCHGITGDGYGPAATLLNPYPRDFTQGKFKFKSTATSRQPTRADLLRVLHRGIPGTAMPSFRSLPSEQKEALAEYVQYLSVRGQMQTALALYCMEELDQEDALDADREPLIDELLVPIVELWRNAPQHVIRPPEQDPSPHDRSLEELTRSVDQGRELFYGKRTNCFTCHDDTLPKEAQSEVYADQYDDWNKQVKRFLDNYKDGNQAGQMALLPPRKIAPRDLNSGVLRGGARRVDLYRRIHAGIDGTPMPAVGPLAASGAGVLAPAEIWSLVDYLRQLPSEPAARSRRGGGAVVDRADVGRQAERQVGG